jgi:hypothetical protein
MAIASLPYYAGSLVGRYALPALPNAVRFAPGAVAGANMMNTAPQAVPMSQVNAEGSPAARLQQLRDFEKAGELQGQQRFRPMPPPPVTEGSPYMGSPLPSDYGSPFVGNLPPVDQGSPYVGRPQPMGQEQRFRPMPAPARGGAMQGPPTPPEFSMPGYAKGYANAMPGMSAQQYADQFAGGDVGKVKARQIMVDGQLVNDFYTKGLMEGLLGSNAPKPLEGTPANVPLPPQRPAEFGPSNTSGGFLSSIPFIGGLIGG